MSSRRMIEAESAFKPRLALAVFSVTLCAQFLLVIFTPKDVSWDPSYGLLAAQQKLAGTSPSIFTLVEVDPAQITRVSARPVHYWAPGYQAVPYVLRFGVLDWGAALNATLGLVLITGAVGWFAYFAQILRSIDLALWLSVVVALTRFRWTMPLTYDGGDQLIWGASPWVLIIAAAALQLAKRGLWARAVALAAAAGASGASLFALKYSGIFIALGAAAVFCLICIRRRHWQMMVSAGVAFSVVMAVIHWAGFPQASTPIASEHGQMNIIPALASLGLPAIGATDLFRVLDVIVSGTLTTPFIGVGLSLLLLIGVYAFIRSRAATLFEGDNVLMQLAIGAVAADIVILFLVILDGGNVGLAGRYGRVSGLLLLPILVVIWQAMLHDRRWIWRTFAVTSVLIFLFLPTALATARQLPNLFDRLAHSRSVTDADGIANRHLSPGSDVQSFYDAIESIAPDAVLYTIYPQMAFPLPRRPLLLVEAEEQETSTTLLRRRYYGRSKGGVALLLPAAFEHNGKLEAIKASFLDYGEFVRHDLPADPKWVLWVAVD
jgi:hypothetical protein